MTGQLEDALRLAGVGWLLEEYREERLAAIVSDIASVSEEVSRRVGRRVDVASELDSNRDDLMPLVQSFASPMSNSIRSLVYLLLRGGDLVALDFSYRERRKADLRATISFEAREHEFSSDDLWDAEVLRHLGLMKMGDRPVIHGYFAFRRA